MSAQRPNILFLMTDQQRGDALSLEGHPSLLTPNLDAIGREGAWFRRAYSTCPSCIPARRALLTGLHPASNGLVGFVGGVPIRSRTLPQALRDGGYQTVLVGRHMHQHPESCRYGYEQVTHGSTYVPSDPYAQHLEAAAPGSGGVRGAGISFNGWTARPWHLDERLHPTPWIVEESRKALVHRDRTCPLFLTASFYAPHPPLVPPAFYFERYLRTDRERPAMGDWVQPPEAWGVESARVVLEGEALRAARAGYLGLINHLDDQLTWLIQEFLGASAADGREWLIVFTSDHGEMLGDHAYFRKCEPYEGSARIPFLVRGSPGLGLRAGVECRHPVCLEDILPTCLDVAGLEAPPDLDGRSLLPVLRGETDRVRDVLHGEHAPCYSAEQAHHVLVDERTKYIWRPLDGSEQLFDLADDPREERNLAADRPQDLGAWRERLIEHLRDRPEGFVRDGELVAGRPYPAVLQPA